LTEAAPWRWRGCTDSRKLQGTALESPASFSWRAAHHSPAQHRRKVRNILCRSSDRRHQFAQPEKCQLCLRTGV